MGVMRVMRVAETAAGPAAPPSPGRPAGDPDRSAVYARLHAADRHPTGSLGPLRPRDLDALADSAWWSGRVDESVSVRLRAHSAHVAEGDWRGAGLAAWWLHHTYGRLGRPVAAAGWLHRARHHLEGRPDCPEQCFLALTDIDEAQAHHDPAAALAAARRMNRLAARSGSPDLLALSRQAEGALLLAQGRRAEGLALLDAAMGAVTRGEPSGMTTGLLYCLALDTCGGAAEFGRLVRWTGAAMAWCATAPNPFRAPCRLHHVEVLDLLGDWARAEEEARLVCQEALEDALDTAAAAAYAVGEVRRRQGRRDEAARSYARAHALGRVPQPGLALLRLAQGRADAALAGLRLALDCQSDPGHAVLGRARLLAALVEVDLAVGRAGAAEEAVVELEELASARGVPLLAAMAATARGALAPGAAAREPLRRGLALWRGLGIPYEAARTRMLLAAAERAAGDTEAARRTLTAARRAFERLGAAPEARRAGRPGTPVSRPRRPPTAA
ncbi:MULTISPECIES: LuxR family transcriptional regulator [unclassified Streptomyces]|uniref:LuxR family transcriptional regulator n=1 Tax=unclassified Streptomyces TaxID=2593676 RepID=UPI002E3252C5|nr:LuxR family transcriptional regulator [Streptomyces sp. NBC_01268]